MNTPVSFELAKSLKDKGFDKKVLCCYNIDNGKLSVAPHHELSNFNAGVHYSAPIITEVLMWLYENHKFWMVVFPIEDGFWAFDIFDYESDCIKSGMEFNSPTEAYEAAIKYILNELI